MGYSNTCFEASEPPGWAGPCQASIPPRWLGFFPRDGYIQLPWRDLFVARGWADEGWWDPTESTINSLLLRLLAYASAPQQQLRRELEWSTSQVMGAPCCRVPVGWVITSFSPTLPVVLVESSAVPSFVTDWYPLSVVCDGPSWRIQ